jgi:hypothetical protein
MPPEDYKQFCNKPQHIYPDNNDDGVAKTIVSIIFNVFIHYIIQNLLIIFLLAKPM